MHENENHEKQNVNLLNLNVNLSGQSYYHESINQPSDSTSFDQSQKDSSGAQIGGSMHSSSELPAYQKTRSKNPKQPNSNLKVAMGMIY